LIVKYRPGILKGGSLVGISIEQILQHREQAERQGHAKSQEQQDSDE
jgi:hypothetical protein